MIPISLHHRLTDKTSSDQKITSGHSLYQTTTDSLTAQWTYNDTESDIERGWYAVGTYPFAEDIAPITEVEISSMDFSTLPLATVTAIDTGKTLFCSFLKAFWLMLFYIESPCDLS